MHPFPILERCLEKDLVVKGKLIATAGTHAIMFTSDFSTTPTTTTAATTTTTTTTTTTSTTSNSSHTKYVWPIFGAGPRSCAGIHLAKPILKVSFSHVIIYNILTQNQNNNNNNYNNKGLNE